MELVYSLMAPFRSVSSVLVGALALLRAAHAQDDFASDCSAFIDKISLDNVTVTSTEFVAAGTNLTVYVPASCGSASHQVVSTDLCRATMNVTTSERSGIRLEAWFPQNYTGRFLSTGNGGIGGCKYPPPSSSLSNPELVVPRLTSAQAFSIATSTMPPPSVLLPSAPTTATTA